MNAPPLDLARYSTRPVRGGWVATCRDCGREQRRPVIDDVARWQWGHTCLPAAVALATRRRAELLLASITPDPAHVILQRRADLVADVRAHAIERRRTARDLAQIEALREERAA